MTTKKVLEFPKDVLLGTASSAYQIEGGWDVKNKSPSIWDHFFHNNDFPIIPDNPWSAEVKTTSRSTKKVKPVILQRGININELEENHFIFKSNEKEETLNGDIACDSIHQLDEDIKNLKELGVDVYRFSICWPRVLPDGDDRTPNQAGIDYYKNLIQKLEDNNIKPLVTMYHWDLPQCLQELGGLANPNIITYFENYATFLFKTFGDKVKLWSTFNEPRMIADGYCYKPKDGKIAPGISNIFSGVGNYMAVRTMLLAHAAIYKIYKNSFKEEQGGEISINFDITWFYPNDPNSEADCKAADRAFAFMVKMLIQPLITGEFPKEVIDGIDESNKRENITLKRFVDFTEEEKKSVKGSYDFLGFNYYFASKARASTQEEFEKMDLKTKDVNFIYGLNMDLDDACKGLARVIKWFEEECNNPTLFLMENGVSESYGQDQSQKKVDYFYSMLTEVHKAIERGIKIKGYCTWSFMDSMEWTSGFFSNLYGIYSVDFNDPKRPRSKKASYPFFEKLFKERKLEHITVQKKSITST